MFNVWHSTDFEHDIEVMPLPVCADLTTPDDAPLRETIEVRVLAQFDQDTDREARRGRFQAQVPNTLPNGMISSWASR